MKGFVREAVLKIVHYVIYDCPLGTCFLSDSKGRKNVGYLSVMSHRF